MGFKINGEVNISTKDIGNVGIATMDLVDAKVSSKAITEQTQGAESDVTGDEVLIYDAEGFTPKVTVDKFIGGIVSGIIFLFLFAKDNTVINGSFACMVNVRHNILVMVVKATKVPPVLS